MIDLSSVLHAPQAQEVVEQLCQHMRARNFSDTSIDTVRLAHRVADHAHASQMRKSGEPYIFHPLAVARILLDLHTDLDAECIVAAILHDVLEDTTVTPEEMTATFGPRVTHLVDGVSKMAHAKFKSRHDAQAENLRKMLVAMTKDLPVIWIKLADRLHNMRTLGSMPAVKRQRIARETLEIYAPIAHRFGAMRVKDELEDLCFKALYPKRYEVLQAAIVKARQARSESISRIVTKLEQKLTEKQIDADVRGREKQLYSLYKKMRETQRNFKEVYDLFGVRVIVKNIDDCYLALGAVHSLFSPRPHQFKDYIAVPKKNGYQSLHTTLKSKKGDEGGVNIEVQIRTEQMEITAQHGIAAHWMYKTDEDGQTSTRLPSNDWIKSLMQVQSQSGDSREFYEHVKIDLYPSEIYVFTPKGDVVRLPKNATALDFAYHVHSEVGDAAMHAKVDNRLVQLDEPLYSGQTIEIVTAKSRRPNPSWLKYATSAKALSAIRHSLRSRKRSEAISLGHRLLKRALSHFDQDLDDINPAQQQHALDHYQAADLDQLLLSIGHGSLVPSEVVSVLLDLENLNAHSAHAKQFAPLSIESAQSSQLTLAKCCKPIPGDGVEGFITKGKGVTVHRRGCNAAAQLRHDPRNWVNVEWPKVSETCYLTNLHVEMSNEPGSLHRVTETLNRFGINIDYMSFKDDSSSSFVTILFTLSVHHRVELARLIRKLRLLSCIGKIYRPLNH